MHRTARTIVACITVLLIAIMAVHQTTRARMLARRLAEATRERNELARRHSELLLLLDREADRP